MSDTDKASLTPTGNACAAGPVVRLSDCSLNCRAALANGNRVVRHERLVIASPGNSSVTSREARQEQRWRPPVPPRPLPSSPHPSVMLDFFQPPLLPPPPDEPICTGALSYLCKLGRLHPRPFSATHAPTSAHSCPFLRFASPTAAPRCIASSRTLPNFLWATSLCPLPPPPAPPLPPLPPFQSCIVERWIRAARTLALHRRSRSRSLRI